MGRSQGEDDRRLGGIKENKKGSRGCASSSADATGRLGPSLKSVAGGSDNGKRINARLLSGQNELNYIIQFGGVIP